MKYDMDKEICKWGEYFSRSTLFVSRIGELFIEKYEQDYEKPLFARTSKDGVAQRIATEKYDFNQEELLYLAEYDILPKVIKLLNEKFRR